jgi:hypothetical protein
MSIAAVSRVRTSNTSSVSTVANAVTFNAVAGNLLVTLVQWQVNNFSSIADTAGNTWVQAGTEVVSGNNKCRIYYAENCAANASNVVTVTFSAASTYRAIVVHQFSGVATSSSLDDAKNATGSSTTPATASLTATASEDVIVAMILAVANSNTAGTGYTGVAFAFVGDPVAYMMDEYHIVTASEAATSTCANGSWYITAAMFKGATAATGQPTMRRWGGVPNMGGQGIGNKGSGKMWGRTRSGLYVPNHTREAA